MKRWHTLTAVRKYGAIGVFEQRSRIVEAETREEARFKAIDEWHAERYECRVAHAVPYREDNGVLT